MTLVEKSQLAAAFGVSYDTVSQVIRGKHWATVGMPALKRPDKWHDAALAKARAARLVMG